MVFISLLIKSSSFKYRSNINPTFIIFTKISGEESSQIRKFSEVLLGFVAQSYIKKENSVTYFPILSLYFF